MSEKEEDLKDLAKEMAGMIHKNIVDVTNALTININYEKKHTILAAYAGVYAVCNYFEYKLAKMGIAPGAIQKAKEGADKYVLDVISGDIGGFPTEKGEA
jgi:hypothetical protein